MAEHVEKLSIKAIKMHLHVEMHRRMIYIYGMIGKIRLNNAQLCYKAFRN